MRPKPAQTRREPPSEAASEAPVKSPRGAQRSAPSPHHAPGFVAHLTDPIASDITFFWCSVAAAIAAAAWAIFVF